MKLRLSLNEFLHILTNVTAMWAIWIILLFVSAPAWTRLLALLINEATTALTIISGVYSLWKYSREPKA